MTQEQIISGNVLIAQKLGAIKVEVSDELYPNGYWDFENGSDWASDDQLAFHEDWNWLADAYLALGFDDMSTNIESAWNTLVDTLKSQSN